MGRTFQLLFYALRPGFIRTQKPTKWHALNLLVVLSFDFLLVKIMGWYPMFYLLISSLLAGSLHPCAAHFIAEHYLMDGPKEMVEGPGGVVGLAQETTSYYGKLNWLCYNVSELVERRSCGYELTNRLGTTMNTTTSLLSLGQDYLNSVESHGTSTPLSLRTHRGHTSRGSSSQTPM